MTHSYVEPVDRGAQQIKQNGKFMDLLKRTVRNSQFEYLRAGRKCLICNTDKSVYLVADSRPCFEDKTQY